MKGLTDIVDHNSIKQFPPGYYLRFDKKGFNFIQYYSFEFHSNIILDFDNYDIKTEMEIVKTGLINSVELMLEADRPLGALLSGGLDSSLVVSIASKYLKKYDKRLQTFSIGMPGATDKNYAELVSKFCDTDHTHIEFSNEDFINAIKDVIWVTETFDITTIRASTGQYLVSKWISENTNIKVLLIGDGADELCSGYMYFHKAPNPGELHKENCKLLREIHLYD